MPPTRYLHCTYSYCPTYVHRAGYTRTQRPSVARSRPFVAWETDNVCMGRVVGRDLLMWR
jgi:hypothetical protein